MQENVERPDDLYEGPQSSWLGYLALAERVNIGDYKRYIEQVLVIILDKYASIQIETFSSRTSQWCSLTQMPIPKSAQSATRDSANIKQINITETPF